MVVRRPRTRRGARGPLAHNNLLAFPCRYGFTVPSLTRLLGDAGLRAVKAALRALARGRPEDAPWIELYARRGSAAGLGDGPRSGITRGPRPTTRGITDPDASR